MSTENLPNTLQEAILYFSDPDVCLNLMVSLRWPEGVTCPRCGSREVRFIATRRMWECKTKHAKKQFSVKVGSVFEDSTIKLDKWFCAIWLVSNAKNGISSYEVHRSLGVTQKTAWYMMHRIRLAMQTGTFEKLSGTIEVDETYIGGKARFMHQDRKERTLEGGRGTAGKTVVMGLLERSDKKVKDKKQEKLSKVQATVIKKTDQETLHREVFGRVETGSELMTDEHGGYQGLEEDYTHKVINHAETYVQGHVYRNPK